jgi:hypothetical protein
MNVATMAGVVSTALFASSMLPMLVRAARTRDLTSYSRSHLVLTNVGNVVHSVYVVHLPFGPIWALHAFYLATASLMLIWHLRHAPADTLARSRARRATIWRASVRQLQASTWSERADRDALRFVQVPCS